MTFFRTQKEALLASCNLVVTQSLELQIYVSTLIPNGPHSGTGLYHAIRWYFQTARPRHSNIYHNLDSVKSSLGHCFENQFFSPCSTQAADGLILVENEALTTTCRRLLNIPRPSYSDLNLVAARALACVLLPARWRSEVWGDRPIVGTATEV